jgi:DNA-binding response OmpR family regulator
MAQKILLAEDDGNLRETLAEALRAEGYEVVAVANGQAAIEAVDAEMPAVAILDGLMPKVNGFDVAKAIRQRTQELPIVFITGVYKSPAQQAEARDKYGSRAFLVKPFDTRRLIDTVKPLLFSGQPAAAAQAPQQPLPEGGSLLENPVMFLAWRAAREMHSGTLELFGERERARVFIFKGRAAFAQHSDPSLNVGVELIRLGVMAAETYKQATDLALERATGLFDVIKAENFADDASVKAAYKALIPRVLERVVAMSGRFRYVPGEAYGAVVPAQSSPLLDPLFAGLRNIPEREIEPHVTPRRPLRLAPGDNWSEVVGRLAESCGSDSLARAINGRATIAQLVEAASNANERVSRFRQVYLLMSTMSVRASMEPIPMSAPAPAPAPAPVAPAPAPAPMPVAGYTGPSPIPSPNPSPPRPSPAAPAPQQSSRAFETSGPISAAPGGRPVFDERADANVRFTPEEQTARKKIEDKLADIEGKDFFAVLGLQRGADAAALKKAYFALARDYHTDAFAGLNLGTAQKKLDHVFQSIQTAYATLTDDNKRGEYEAEMAFKEQGASTDVAAILAAEAEMHKARLLVDRGEIAGALKLVDKVLTVAPKNDEALGYKLYCAWWQTKRVGDVAGLCKQLEVHFKAQPGALSLKEFQGWLQLEAGDLKLAKSAFKKVLEFEPAHQGATRGMRQLSRKQEELDKKNSGLGKFLKR